MKVTPAEIAKFITAALGAASIAVTQGLISGTTAKWVAVIIGAAVALGVYVVPNALPAGTKLVRLEGPGEPLKSGRPVAAVKPPPVAPVPTNAQTPPPAAPTPPAPPGRPHGGGQP